MRRLLFTILILVSLGASAQFTNTHEQSNQNTREVFKGGVKVNRGIINSIYPDTATANLNPIAFYHAGMIVVGDTLFLRNTAANKWIKVGSGSSSGGLSDGDYGDITVSGGGTIMTIDNGVVTNAKLQNSSITVQGVPISLGGSGDIINGTGFVKASGTTITYDNSTYFSTASEGLTSSGNDIRLFGALATPAQLTTERSINLRGNILHFNSRENQTVSGGPIWQHSDRPFSPYQFFSIDTLNANSVDPPTAAMPVSGIFARRTLFYNDGIFTTQKVYGHYLGLTYNWKDSMRFRTEGGDYNQSVIAEMRLKPRGTGAQRTGHNGTGNNDRPYYGVPAFVANFILENTDGVNTIHTYGWTTGISSYFVASENDTSERHSFYQTNSFINASTRVRKFYGLDFQHHLAAPAVDSSFGLWDQYGYFHYMRGNTVIGLGSAWATSDKLKVWGNVNISDTLNIGASNAVTDTLGVDIMMRRRTNGGVERIRADQLGALIGGSPLLPTTGTGTATGNVIGNLAGNTLQVQQGGSNFLSINPTAGSEVSTIRAFNTTGAGNGAEGTFQTTNTNATFINQASFNDGAKLATITGFADVAASSITYTADTHTFVAGGNNYIELDGVGFNSRIRAEDGTASSQLIVAGDLVGNNVKFNLNSNDGSNDVSILGDAQANSITHTADVHTFNANAQTALFIDGTTNGEVSELKATNITGGGNLSKLNLSVSDVNGGFNLSTAFDNESKEAKIVGAVTSGSSSIIHTADQNTINGAVRLVALAGNGAGIVAADNDGDLSWMATPGGVGTVTDVTWVGGIVSIATSTTTPAFTIAGTSGGIPYFSSTTTWASSGLLTSDAIVLGGGAGGAPTTLALGTANQVLGMNAAGTAHEYKTQQVGTAGTDVAIAHGVGTVTLNVPDASASNRGVITTGTQTIAGTKTFSGQVVLNGLLNSANYNLSTGAGGAGTSSTTAQILFAGASSVGYRAAFRGSTAYTMVANNSHGAVIIGEHAVTESGSGTHALVAQLVVKPLVVTNGAGAVTDLATVYIEGPNTGITPTAGTFSVWVDAGITRLDGNVTIGGGTVAASATASLHLINGTIPSASIAEGVVLYAEDVAASSELKVRDEAGNITTLSPHNFTGIEGGRSESMAVAIYSERDSTYINIDIVKLARQVEKLTGEKLVFIGDTKKKPNPFNK